MAGTGLYYFRARYYKPAIGRFLQPDPSGYTDGSNLYTYVGNNPLAFVDPLGLCKRQAWDAMTFEERFGEGYYYGTAFGEEAQAYWTQQYAYADSWYEQAYCTAGLGLSSCWTRENYQRVMFELALAGATTSKTAAKAAQGAWKAVGKTVGKIFGKAPVGGANGIVAQNGTTVKGFTSHGVDRVIGDTAKRAGTKPKAILDAIKNPQKIVSGVDKQGRPFQVFTGKDARVVVNPQTGKVVSVNPLSGAGAH